MERRDLLIPGWEREGLARYIDDAPLPSVNALDVAPTAATECLVPTATTLWLCTQVFERFFPLP